MCLADVAAKKGWGDLGVAVSSGCVGVGLVSGERFWAFSGWVGALDNSMVRIDDIDERYPRWEFLVRRYSHLKGSPIFSSSLIEYIGTLRILLFVWDGQRRDNFLLAFSLAHLFPSYFTRVCVSCS